MIFDLLNPPVLGPHLGTLKSCKSSVKVWLLKSFWFSRYGVFYDFFFFFKKLRYKKLIELKFLNPTVGCFRGSFEGYKSGLNMTAQIHMIFEIWLFLWFFQFFPKNLFIKKLTELEFFNPLMGCDRGTLKSSKHSVQVWLLKSFWFSIEFSFSFFQKT